MLIGQFPCSLALHVAQRHDLTAVQFLKTPDVVPAHSSRSNDRETYHAVYSGRRTRVRKGLLDFFVRQVAAFDRFQAWRDFCYTV